MNPIKDNPYRTLGLLAGASTREISRQTNRLYKIIATEQEPPTDDFSFPVLGKLTRTEPKTFTNILYKDESIIKLTDNYLEAIKNNIKSE